MNHIKISALAIVMLFAASCGSNNDKKMSEALARYDFETARKYVKSNKEVPEQLTRAEISYKLSNGQRDMAQATAREDGYPELFNMMYADYISKLIGEEKLDQALSELMSWTFFYSPTDMSHYFKSEKEAHIRPYRLSKLGSGKGWELYNQEAEQFNNLLDRLMSAYILKNDMTNANKCIILYAPTYVPVVRISDRYDPVFLQNIAQDRAKEKLKVSGSIQ